MYFQQTKLLVAISKYASQHGISAAIDLFFHTSLVKSYMKRKVDSDVEVTAIQPKKCGHCLL